MTPEALTPLGHYLTFLLVLFLAGFFLTLSEPTLRLSQRVVIGLVIAVAWPWFGYRLLRRLFAAFVKIV